ncbi:hypothetical protein [Brevibacillus borstelensis]|uniref:hypothetical protein n=1 Tax=Brevibacillus borstelensis TaxID=45462 RepID=UPI0030BF1A3E
MKEPLRTRQHTEMEDSTGLQQLVELINAKGDTGEIEQILSESGSNGSEPLSEADDLRP